MSSHNLQKQVKYHCVHVSSLVFLRCFCKHSVEGWNSWSDAIIQRYYKTTFSVFEGQLKSSPLFIFEHFLHQKEIRYPLAMIILFEFSFMKHRIIFTLIFDSK